MALDLIYDRTQADTDRWIELSRKLDSLGWSGLTKEEQQAWLNPLKGAYNYTDMNRVGKAVKYLASRYDSLIPHLQEYRERFQVANDRLLRPPYTAKDVAVKPRTDWLAGEHVREHDAARYLLDLLTLRSLMPVPAGTPNVPADMVDLTRQEANDIERMLDMLDKEITRYTAEVEQWIRNTAASWLYTGELYSGEA